MAEREFTGRHAAMVFVGAFGVIIAVNLLLAFSAVKTFPGLEVKNSYVASQEFDARRIAQTALGWKVAARATGGLVILSITDQEGAPVQVTSLEAILGRATHMKDDMEPAFQFDGSVYVAPAELAGGNWNIRMKATAQDGTEFTQRVVLYVKG
ncbi:Nitrogen fixation protein FixH [Shimia gijangensis]|uniref:Nitrogen fixation protein FixH n=1 Tax=Shimia gijangensis TaxID=1470563 RepID=A0A1M6KK54_9RHOB|nr:FixH family protein [Shimia gijangensis]SHJ59309.1 Nitrogen fixation protein FixH [Shimia gijangensis]